MPCNRLARDQESREDGPRLPSQVAQASFELNVLYGVGHCHEEKCAAVGGITFRQGLLQFDPAVGRNRLSLG